MIIDSFTLHKAIFQVQYADAFAIWDRAGAIAQRLTQIWPNLEAKQGQPHIQILAGDGVEIQTGLTKSTVNRPGYFGHLKQAHH